MEADPTGDALARRGFLAGLVGVCSGCLLSACSAGAAPSAAPASLTPVPTGRSATGGGRVTRRGGSTTQPGPGRATRGSDDPTRTSAPTTGPSQPSPSQGGGGQPGNGGGPGPSRTPSPTEDPTHQPTHRPKPSPSPTSPSPSDPGMALAPLSAIPVGGAYVVQKYKIVLTQPTSGEVHGFSALCTHMGCIVGAASGELKYPCHGSRFSLTDGSVIEGPAQTALGAQPVKVVDGYVYPA